MIHSKEANNMKIINLLGAPGSGKSTTALGLTYFLKMKGCNVEYVGEYAKDLVFKKDFLELEDQFNIFAQQNNRFKILKEVDLIVTDSPLIFTAMYPNKHYPISQFDAQEQEAFESVVVSQFKRYDNYNIYLERAHKYVDIGRTQTEQEASLVGEHMKKFLKKHKIDIIELTTGPNICEGVISILERDIIEKELKTLKVKGNSLKL